MRLFQHKILGGTLLVSGTAIGAGMLALPITTGVGGFIGAALLFIVCYLFMLLSLMLLFEANGYSSALDANIITMARQRLGGVGEIVAWVSFLLLLYAVVAAYVSAGGSLLDRSFDLLFNKRGLISGGIILFTILCGVMTKNRLK